MCVRMVPLSCSVVDIISCVEEINLDSVFSYYKHMFLKNSYKFVSVCLTVAKVLNLLEHVAFFCTLY